MSQVSFKTTYSGFPVEVVAGWDEPLKYYHFTVFDLRVDAKKETIFCNLDDKDPFAVKTTDKWKQTLTQMNIAAPVGFWERVERKEGNALYKFANGQWSK